MHGILYCKQANVFNVVNKRLRLKHVIANGGGGEKLLGTYQDRYFIKLMTILIIEIEKETIEVCICGSNLKISNLKMNLVEYRLGDIK